jgi:hypothetical protein
VAREGKQGTFVSHFDFEQAVEDIGLGHFRFVGNDRLVVLPPVIRPDYLIWLEAPSLRLVESVALPETIVRSTIIDSSFSADARRALCCTDEGHFEGLLAALPPQELGSSLLPRRIKFGSPTPGRTLGHLSVRTRRTTDSRRRPSHVHKIRDLVFRFRDYVPM